MPNLVYILFSQRDERDPIGVYSSKELAHRQAEELNLNDWFILVREYI